MKQFLTVLKFELNNYFKNKSFMVTTFILAFIIAAIVIVPTMIPGFLNDESQTEEIGVVEENIEEVPESDQELPAQGICVDKDASDVNVELICAAFPADWKTYESMDAVKEAVEAEEIEAGFVMKSPTEAIYVVNDLSTM